MWETKQLPVAIDFHSIFFYHMKVNGYRQLVTNILHNIIFCEEESKSYRLHYKSYII